MNRLRATASLIAVLLLLLIRPSSASAVEYKEDDPLPPGAHGEIVPLKGETLPLKGVIVPLKGAIVPLKGVIVPLRGLDAGMAGAGSALHGAAENLQGALKDLGATVTGRQIKINLAADVLFDFDKADLRPEAGPELEKVLAVLKSYPAAKALIEGHTDGKGSDSYNQPLSERRAEAVRRWLVDHGATTTMMTRGWGKTRPIAPNTKPNGADDPEGRQKNRRVEITVNT
jgi:outer membrane protein OmpA-like peptidoglycan-associated protein